MKRDLSRYIDYVRKGGIVRVFDRDTPVADLVPLARGEKSDDAIHAIIDRLVREGKAVRRGTGKFDTSKLGPPVKTRRSVAEAIIEERREGR